jgi:hypothetical protein
MNQFTLINAVILLKKTAFALVIELPNHKNVSKFKVNKVFDFSTKTGEKGFDI